LNERHIVIITRVICGDNYFIIMSRMLLINETFLLLRNQSLSIEYEQLSCISNVKIWIIIHFIIAFLIESLLSYCFYVAVHNDIILPFLLETYTKFHGKQPVRHI
jgi:hypothetical protein